MHPRVVVAMSGGVDSSVAAALLVQQGYGVLGMTLQLWGKDICVSSGSRLCCSVRDALDARAVAKRLNIPHQTLDLAEVFRERVINDFVASYAKGLTPNPCIACNDHIKFGALLECARQLGAECVATGHYARVSYDEARGRWALRRSLDSSKDQSYVLFGLTQHQLSRCLFPVGAMSKPAVRELASELGLVTARKPDSQDICFVRDRDKDGFLRRELNIEEHPGPIVDTQGRHLGMHRGLIGYTIGQREGLGIAVGRPLYVVEIDQPRNRLIVGSQHELLRARSQVSDANWMSIEPPHQPLRAEVKIRARHQPASATLVPAGHGGCDVEFDVPQAAVTPGQAAVFYDGEVVLGGGTIRASASAGDDGDDNESGRVACAQA